VSDGQGPGAYNAPVHAEAAQRVRSARKPTSAAGEPAGASKATGARAAEDTVFR